MGERTGVGLRVGRLAYIVVKLGDMMRLSFKVSFLVKLRVEFNDDINVNSFQSVDGYVVA